jgi:two-component system, chemotaxis family, CheB/CheR fusion protein
VSERTRVNKRKKAPGPNRQPAPESKTVPVSPSADPAPGHLGVVAIGASAGGLEALEKFFAAVPRDSGLAYVVVQHLERRHPSMLAELLERASLIPVRQAADGDPLQPDTVLVIPPNALLTLSQGILHLSAPQDEPRAIIDTFFHSLAQDRAELAAAVILSGTGSDGTCGLRAIREQGGLGLAQRPDTAAYPDMPQSAISAGFVDVVLDVAEMPARLLEHFGHHQESAHGLAVQEAEVRDSLPALCELLRRTTAHDFSRYKEGALLRRTLRRIQLLRLDANEYLRRLENDPEEPRLLIRDLLIGVTQFFREPAAFEALAEKALAKLLEDKNGARPIRIWVPGCATGEEVYSIAIFLQEQLAALKTSRPIQLFATDIDSEALAAARAGRYRANIAEQVSPERLARFFVLLDDGYQVVKELRDICVFSVHSLIRDPPFSALDLVSCRNLLIYLEPDLQKRVIPLLHYALKRSGYLFLGSSEELSGHTDLFAPLDKKHRLFQRKDTVVRPMMDLPLSAPHTLRGSGVSAASDSGVRNPKQVVQQGFERMVLEDFAPASAVVDERGEMLCRAGRLEPLLKQPTGMVTINILDHAEGALRHALRTALAEAVAKREEVVRPDIVADVGAVPHRLRLTIRPAPAAPSQSGLYAVVIEDLGPAHPARIKGKAFAHEPVLEQLENELKTTRADLQSANEDLEGANEELKSSNEELISTNEELQSANEELQTSKEELQSLNEELETVNSELRQKVGELGVANSDLQNLFSATQVATIFLDREQKLAKFTPAATTLFRFIDSDLGRPLSDLAPRFAGTDLLADVAEVLRTLVPVEREIRAGEAWFVLRVLPYRTLDDAIAGAVVTFADVTKLKRAETALRESERLLKDVIDGSPSMVFLKDLQGRFLTVNKPLETLLGMSRDRLKGMTDYDLFPPERAEYYREHDRQVAQTRRPIDVEEVIDLPDGQHVFLASKFPLFDSAGRLYGVGAISHEITERKQAEELVQRYAGLLRLSQDAIHVRRVGGPIEFWNAGAERLYGFAEEQVLGRNAHELLQTLGSTSMTELDGILAREGQWEGELVHRVRDGRVVTVSTRMQLLRGEDGIERILQSSHDVTERKQAEQALSESKQRLAAIVDSIADGFYALDGDWRVTHMNDTALGYFGMTRDQVLGRPILELFPGLAGSDFEAEFRRARESGTPTRIQAPSVVTDRIVEVFAYPGHENLTVWFRDVTERELQAQQVAHLTQLYSVLSQVNETIVRTHDEGRLLQEVCRIVTGEMALPLVWVGLVENGVVKPAAASGSATDYLDGVRVEIQGELGQGPTGSCIREDRPVVNDDFESNDALSPWREGALRQGFRASAAFPLCRHGKAVGAFTLYSGKPAAFDAEHIKLLGALAADLSYALDAIETDRLRDEAEQAVRESEHELRDADARKNEFLAMLSHELRNPLAPIRNSLYILQHAHGETQQVERAQAVIGRQVTHLTRLVDDLLDVTRITRGKINLEKEPLDLDELVGRAVEDHRDLFTQNGIVLTFRPSGDQLRVHGDKTRLAQIVGNLLQNAVKFTPRGGATAVSVEPNEGAQAAIRVRDTGAGISADILPHLFQPFIQADRTLDRSKGGLGLGLALVKGLVEMHGGSVTVGSEGPGKGAQFEVLLPLVSAATVTEARAPAVESQCTPRRVLVIEDNRDAADSLREVLELEQHQAMVAYSGAEGIEKARAFLPDYVLCDIGLPGMDGYEVARALRNDAALASTTLVALTGYAAAEDISRSQEAGFDHHLAKPPSIEAIERVLTLGRATHDPTQHEDE